MAEHSTVSNNIVIANDDNGICLDSSDFVSITGNIAEGNGTTGYEAGIYLGDADDNILAGNICENNRNGIYIAADCDRNVVTGNRATGNNTLNFDNDGSNTTDSGNDWN